MDPHVKAEYSQEEAVPRKMSSSPSPTASISASSNSASAARRISRKSTLTQQQKNHKRQRATQDQLVTLEVEFNKNPTPTAMVRERIAEDINMTERSVQIWFQNKRAKIKFMAKKSIETGEGCDMPDSMRHYLAMQEMESGKFMGGHFLGRGGVMPYIGGGLFRGGDQIAQGKVVIHHLECTSLSIGTWSRHGESTMDLIIFYSPDKSTMTYYINNDQAGYKIEYSFSCIKNIFLENGDIKTRRPGGLVMELNRPPMFFMDSSGSGGFFQCGDFTQDQQASQVMIHHLVGNPKVLARQLARLISLDAFMNRHNPNPPVPFDSQQLSASAPVSPTAHRPASQPSYKPQAHLGMFQESQWGARPQQAGRGLGHRRQRSRSVPAPIDFSLFSAPMPSFLIQHPTEAHPHQSNANIFSPIPQDPSALGNNLRIDTSQQYGVDYRQYPMSATTSSSDYTSPSYFPQGLETGSLIAPASTPHAVTNSNYTTYSMSFLSPDSAAMVPQTSVSPLSFKSHGDPAIVDQSPPHMSMLHRSASADIFHMSRDPSNLSDDGSGLNDLYSKHSLDLPMHTPSPAFAEQLAVDMDMNSLVTFDNPQSLSPPESTGQRVSSI